MITYEVGQEFRNVPVIALDDHEVVVLLNGRLEHASYEKESNLQKSPNENIYKPIDATLANVKVVEYDENYHSLVATNVYIL